MCVKYKVYSQRCCLMPDAAILVSGNGIGLHQTGHVEKKITKEESV